MNTNLALLPSAFLSGLLILIIVDLVEFVTKVFTGLLILYKSQSEERDSRWIEQTFFAAFFFGAALALVLGSAFALG